MDILRDIPIVIHGRIFFLPPKGHLCGVALIPKLSSDSLLLSLILLTDQILAVLRRKVPSSQLIPADPGDSSKSIREFLLINIKRDLNLRMLQHDPIPVMTIHDDTVPGNDGVLDPAFFQNQLL